MKPTAQELWERIEERINTLHSISLNAGTLFPGVTTLQIIQDYAQTYHEEHKKERCSAWIKYIDQKPENGKLVMVYRDIESKQIYVTHWNNDEELYADWNEVTHWAYINYPPNPKNND